MAGTAVVAMGADRRTWSERCCRAGIDRFVNYSILEGREKKESVIPLRFQTQVVGFIVVPTTEAGKPGGGLPVDEFSYFVLK